MAASEPLSSIPANGVSRVLAILTAIAEHPDGITLGQLAKDFDAPKSSVHRALSALVRAGYARQDTSTRYYLGFTFLRLAFGYHAQRQAHLDVEEVLRVLADRFGETTHYGVLVGSQIVYQAKVTPRNPTFQMTSVVGGTNPAFRTGLGKALLMCELPTEAAVEAFVERAGPLVAKTPRTITTARALHRELERSRARGYALDEEENELGLNCVALPLFLDSPSRPTGAVSISAVSQRMSVDALVAAVPDVRRVILDHLGDVLAPIATQRSVSGKGER